MPYCYVIHSEKLNRFYTGICQENPLERLRQHNNHYYGNQHFTAKASDWTLFLHIECDSLSHARQIEIHIKNMKSSTNIKNLKKYPELVRKIKSRFK